MSSVTLNQSTNAVTVVSGARGPKGTTGDTGATGADGNSAGLYFTFSTTTSMADPGAGLLRFNNATPASATAIAIDDTSADSGNPDVSAEIISWDDSTATNKGTLIIREVGSPENFHIYTVTGLTDNSGWTQIAVTHVAGSGTFADSDNISVEFSRTGDDGADGAGTGDMEASTYDPATIAEQLVGLTATQTLTNKTLTSPTINSPALGTDSVDAITEIASALKSGSDGTLITGTAGTSGDLSVWDANGDLVDGPTPPSGDIVGTSDSQTLTNKTLTSPAISTPTMTGTPIEDIFAISGTTPAIAGSDGSIQTWTLTGNSTPTDGMSAGEAITVMVDDGASAYTVTWTSLVDQWIGGSAPTLPTSGYAVIILWKVSTTVYASYVGDASAP